MRGGSWVNLASLLRSAARSGVEIEQRYSHYGFRVARMIDPEVLLSKMEPSPRSRQAVHEKEIYIEIPEGRQVERRFQLGRDDLQHKMRARG